MKSYSSDCFSKLFAFDTESLSNIGHCSLDSYSEFIAGMENFLESRSVTALMKKIAALKQEASIVEVADAEVVENLKILADRTASANDATTLNEINEVHKEKT